MSSSSKRPCRSSAFLLKPRHSLPMRPFSVLNAVSNCISTLLDFSFFILALRRRDYIAGLVLSLLCLTSCCLFRFPWVQNMLLALLDDYRGGASKTYPAFSARPIHLHRLSVFLSAHGLFT